MQRGETRDFRLKTLGLKFRSDKNISKWPPEAVALPILAGKCPPLFDVGRFGDVVAHPILGGLHHRYARIQFSEGTAATVRNIVWYDRKNIRFAATRLPVEAKR